MYFLGWEKIIFEQSLQNIDQSDFYSTVNVRRISNFN